MSRIKEFTETTLTKAKAAKFKTEILPALLGLSYSATQKIYYTGTYNVEHLFKISSFLGCDINELYEFPEHQRDSLTRFINEVKL